VARKGFTLLEVLMVIVVLTILASLSFGLLRVAESSRIRLAQNQVDSLGFQASKAAGLKGFPPETLEELAPKVERPDWMKGGKFVDAWERPIEYRVEGKKFRLWSCGPDGISGTDDDLSYKRN
jgi:prepilin-type N-terminal cleavage/methylation domain-containing protein